MKRMQLLDYGRFFAAISVIAFHYLFNGIHNGKISSITHIPEVIDLVKYGYLGVEFFFMISGYVIFFSAKNRRASQFAVSRAVRLYPAFWVAIIFTSSFAVFWGGEQMAVYPSLILTNFTMVSPIFGRGFVDGVYWTLIFELKFYILVFILLICGAQKKLDHIFLLWPVVIAIAVYYEKDYLPYLGSYFCYFSAGAILAMMKERKNVLHYSSLLLSLYLCVSFSAGKAPELSEAKGIFYSELIIGCIVAMFFMFFIIANSKIGSNLSLYGSRLLGGLTYPIYLIHAHFGYMFISQFATEENKLLIYLLTVFIVLSASYLIHILVEKKYSNFWKEFFNYIIGKPIEWLNFKSTSMVTAYNNRINSDN
jgi:peptidoglycan/LPS O-acetylase OafA/YrhL